MADVIHRFAPELLAKRHVTSAQKFTLETLAKCRTAALGGHVLQCMDCGDRRIAYNSCRNRHCPSCLNHKSREWLDARESELLPVPYFHIVFTVPQEISALALGNKKVLYNILFSASSEALRTLAEHPTYLGAKIGFLSVLHTWDQKLGHHPHVHCVVPGGGLSPDGCRWVSSRAEFFLPVRVLSKLFRGKFLDQLQRAFDGGKLSFGGSTSGLADRERFRRFLGARRAKNWVVYSKAPFGSPRQVLKYLARYTHRVAISNSRVLSIDGDHVRIRYRKSSADNTYGVMHLSGVEFLRRFVQHVLPKRYQRIRTFGFLANCHKKEKLAQCRALLLSAPKPTEIGAPKDTEAPDEAVYRRACLSCETGEYAKFEELKPRPAPLWHDSS